ncbi:MAG: hypothetical protein ACI9BK_001092, partial [Acidimicrobiales bacterium]
MAGWSNERWISASGAYGRDIGQELFDNEVVGER